MKYKWLLFDADGTLFDYDLAEATALRQTFSSLGLPFRPDYEVVYRRINAAMWLDFEQGRLTQTTLRTRRFEALLAEIEIAANPVRFSQAYLERLAQGTFLIEGAETVLQALHGQVGLALITNGLTEVQRPRLALSAIGRYFSHVIISEEVGFAKPEPRIFDITFERLGHPRLEEVMIIGDSLTSDMTGGSAYGIDTCWFNPTSRSPKAELAIHYEIRELRELLPILGLS